MHELATRFSGFIKGLREKESVPKAGLRSGMSPEALAFQEEMRREYEEASRDPEVAAYSGHCPYGCGWWTAFVSPLEICDVAQMSVGIDVGRHVYHDCPNAPAEAIQQLGPRPKPSH